MFEKPKQTSTFSRVISSKRGRLFLGIVYLAILGFIGVTIGLPSLSVLLEGEGSGILLFFSSPFIAILLLSLVVVLVVGVFGAFDSDDVKASKLVSVPFFHPFTYIGIAFILGILITPLVQTLIDLV